MMNTLPKELYAELTYMTIQKEARWMEYEEDMEDFLLAQQIRSGQAKQATVCLCGYIPQLAMELSILAFTDLGKGIFYSVRREGEQTVLSQEFDLSDYQQDFEVNMLMYAATTQIIMRNSDEAYHNLAKELAEAKSSCSGCSGCAH